MVTRLVVGLKVTDCRSSMALAPVAGPTPGGNVGVELLVMFEGVSARSNVNDANWGGVVEGQGFVVVGGVAGVCATATPASANAPRIVENREL